MNLDVLWHDLECGAYDLDLPLWRALAAETGGVVLDVGAGTGRLSLQLASDGVAVVALDADASDPLTSRDTCPLRRAEASTTHHCSRRHR